MRVQWGAYHQPEKAVDAYPSANYKGFDLYPLVYPYEPPREWHEPRPDRAYNASVVICREGSPPNAEHGRVFALPVAQWESLGAAKRAAVKTGEEIIDGLVEGMSTAGL